MQELLEHGKVRLNEPFALLELVTRGLCKQANSRHFEERLGMLAQIRAIIGRLLPRQPDSRLSHEELLSVKLIEFLSLPLPIELGLP